MIRYNYIIAFIILALLSACGSGQPPYSGIKIGKPYEVSGRTYAPKYNPDYDETGVASWYGPGFHGGKTASGERYDQNDMTAAHKTLPLPSIVRVTNLDNGKSAIIRVNDRGPFASNRIIDLSRAAAIELGVYRTGTAKVRVQFLDQETREYVSRLPNGKQSLIALDKARESNTTEETVADNEDIFSVVDTSIAKENDVTSPFVSSASASEQPQTDSADVFAPVQERQNLRDVYFIQAGTFGVKSNADRLLQELEELGSAKIVENVVKEKTFYRVLAGPYNSNTEAASMLGRLGDIGISGARIVKG